MSKLLYTFGPFQLDAEEQVLLRNGQTLSLKPKAFDVLAVLVENSGRVLSKDDLMKQVWAGSFVEEGNLTVSIFEIRKVLGGSPNGHQYIETVPRRGYRFAACVTEASQHDASRSRDGLVVARSIVAGVSDGFKGPSKGTIAVLPFESIGPTGVEYLGLGMADALITRLSNLRKVTVRPTSSVRKYTGAQDPVLAGKELGVEWVLDGSVQKSRKRIRVTVQLVNVSDGALLWAEKFDEKFTDIFAVEDSISEQVAKALAPKLSGEEKRLIAKRYTENTEAYEAFLKGRYFLEKRTPEGCGRGIEYFKQAIALDPTYALSYAGLAHCYLVFGGYKLLSTAECNASAEIAIMRALELDGDLAEAHSSLGTLRNRQWDWSAAEKEYKTAIELNPNYTIAYVGYALCLGLMGRPDEAMMEIKRAHEIDPLSLPMNSAKGSLLYIARQYDEAIEQFHRTLALDADFAVAHFSLGYAYEAQGRYEEAVTAYQRSRRGLGNILELAGCLGRIHALSGRRDKGLEAITQLRRASKKRYVPSYSIALIYCALGEQDDAFRSLEDAYAEHDEDLFLIKIDPRLDSLRADPRFPNLLQRVGLANSNHLTSSE